MKGKLVILPLTSIFTVSGCSFLEKINEVINSNNTSSNKEETTSNNDKEDKTTDDEDYELVYPNVASTKVGEFYGGLVSDDQYSGYEFSVSLEPIKRQNTGTSDVKIYAFNDFHGSVLKTSYEPGLISYASYFKERSQEPNSLIFDQGDTWQGSLESNYGHGAIVQDVFNYAGVSLRTVGNHDFDWGLEQLEATNNRKLGDDFIPTLAANVYDYNNGVVGNTQQSKYGREYATFILDNGIKVGVVGVIGRVITSICSNRVETIEFTDPVKKIKEVSDYLRTTKSCDIVVASTHDSYGYFIDQGLNEISPNSNKRYVDLVLNGHSHSEREVFENDELLYAQWDSNGISSGCVNLTYNFDNKKVDDSKTTHSSMYYEDYEKYSSNPDQTIKKMVEDYVKQTDEIGNEVLCTNFRSYHLSIEQLMCEAIFDRVKSAGFDIDYSYTNSAREDFYDNVITYRDLYKCFPFDNEIVLMETDRELGSCLYRPSDLSPVDSSKETLLLAVIDYSALHVNYLREYDYYPDEHVHSREILKDESGNAPIYRDILRDYLLARSN